MNTVVDFQWVFRPLVLLGLLALQRCALAEDEYVITDFVGQGDFVRQGALLTDGRIVSFGLVQGASTNGSAIGITRHLNDLSPDLSFGSSGKVVVPNYLDYQDSPSSGVVQSNGKMIIGGARSKGDLSTTRGVTCWLVVRLNPDGSLDKTFNKSGFVMTTMVTKDNWETVADILAQTDGKIVACGYYSLASGSGAAVVRYTSTGPLDSKFGSRGMVKPLLNVVTSARLDALALQQDDKIVAVGRCFSPEHGGELLVMRLQSNGAYDPSFGSGGIVRTRFADTPSLFGRDVKIQPDGRILVAVHALDEIGEDWFGLVRYESNGQLDTRFGNGGFVETHLHGPVGGTSLAAMELQDDGKIVVTGTQSMWIGTTDTGPIVADGFALLRYRYDGTLDEDFADNGVVVDWLGSAADVLIDPEGRIVVFGTSDGYFDADFLVARYHEDGTPDFGP